MEMTMVKEQLQSDLAEAKEERTQLKEQLEDKPAFGLGEGATLAYSWEMGLARRDSIEARIESLEKALARLDEGTYGLCKNCGTQIDPERLEILPTTLLCTSCASKR